MPTEPTTDRIERIARDTLAEHATPRSGIPAHFANDCNRENIFIKIDLTLQKILDRLAKGDTEMALQGQRLGGLEKVVYSILGAAILALVGAVIATVIRK